MEWCEFPPDISCSWWQTASSISQAHKAGRDRPLRPSTIKTEDILPKTNIPAASCQLGFVSKWIKKAYLCSLKSIFGCLLKDGDKSLKPENLEAVQSGEELFVTRRESLEWDRMDSVGWMYRRGARCGPKNPVIISRGSDQLPIYFRPCIGDTGAPLTPFITHRGWGSILV